MPRFKPHAVCACALFALAVLRASHGAAGELTNLQQVLDLGQERARAETNTARLRGVVTMALPNLLCVQDGGAALEVRTRPGPSIHVGDFVEAEGKVGAGILRPLVQEARTKVLSNAPLPNALVLTPAQARSPEYTARRVQITAVVRDAAWEEPRLALRLSAEQSDLYAYLYLPGRREPIDPADWIDARLQLTGAGWISVDGRSRLQSFALHVPDTNHVVVLAPGAANVFARPLVPTRWLRGLPPFEERVRVIGTVTHRTRNGSLFLRDDTGPLLARMVLGLPRNSPRGRYTTRAIQGEPRPGDRVEVVGAPVPSNTAPLMDNAEFRILGPGVPVTPREVPVSDTFGAENDGELVTVSARLLDHEVRKPNNVALEYLLLESDSVLFEARFDPSGTNGLAALPKGSRLEVTGVCNTRAAGWRQNRTFELLLRSPADVRYLGPPERFRREQALLALALLTAVAAAACGWVWLLRRRVRQRTAELVQAREELRQALEHEKELGQLKTNFVNLVSHEFRTPLGVITAAAENLKNYFDRLDPRMRDELLGNIRDASGRMAGLMEEVLLLARCDSGKLQCKPAPLNLREFLGRLTDEMRSSTAGVCPIEVMASAEAAGAVADEGLLRHMLTNLLSNAVKYSAPGRPVHLEVGRDGGDAVFTVRDEGIGIPEADLPQLFHTFHRGSNVGERSGTGLGLIIVKRCVDLHGGHMQIHSRVGQGTTVTVRLPLFGVTPAVPLASGPLQPASSASAAPASAPSTPTPTP